THPLGEVAPPGRARRAEHHDPSIALGLVLRRGRAPGGPVRTVGPGTRVRLLLEDTALLRDGRGGDVAARSEQDGGEGTGTAVEPGGDLLEGRGHPRDVGGGGHLPRRRRPDGHGGGKDRGELPDRAEQI